MGTCSRYCDEYGSRRNATVVHILLQCLEREYSTLNDG